MKVILKHEKLSKEKQEQKDKQFIQQMDQEAGDEEQRSQQFMAKLTKLVKSQKKKEEEDKSKFDAMNFKMDFLEVGQPNTHRSMLSPHDTNPPSIKNIHTQISTIDSLSAISNRRPSHSMSNKSFLINNNHLQKIHKKPNVEIRYDEMYKIQRLDQNIMSDKNMDIKQLHKLKMENQRKYRELFDKVRCAYQEKPAPKILTSHNNSHSMTPQPSLKILETIQESKQDLRDSSMQDMCSVAKPGKKPRWKIAINPRKGTQPNRNLLQMRKEMSENERKLYQKVLDSRKSLDNCNGEEINLGKIRYLNSVNSRRCAADTEQSEQNTYVPGKHRTVSLPDYMKTIEGEEYPFQITKNNNILDTSFNDPTFGEKNNQQIVNNLLKYELPPLKLDQINSKKEVPQIRSKSLNYRAKRKLGLDTERQFQKLLNLNIHEDIQSLKSKIDVAWTDRRWKYQQRKSEVFSHRTLLKNHEL